MENHIKNAYTVYKIDNSYDYGNFISVNGAKFSSPEFALDIWFNIKENGNIIISQKNGFSLGISNDKIIFKHSSISPLSIKNDIIKIPNNTWNNLYMGYDKNELSFYINGINFGAVSCNSDLRNSEDFILGEEFTGYIRSFRLYNKIISENNYKNYCFASTYDEKTMPDTVAFIDCTSKNLPDLSGNNVSAVPHEGCALKNLVDVYKPSYGNYAHFADPSQINPGGFSSKEFSVYTKLYTRPSQNKRQIIAANGNDGDSDSVIIFAQQEDNVTNFGVCFGTEEFIFETKAAEYTWVDFIVSLAGKNVTAYINGIKCSETIKTEFVRTKDGDFKIGGCANSAEKTCEHYLHTAAVFDKILTEKDAADFMNDHPFVLEDNLVALVNFECGSADELVGGSTLVCDKNDLFLAENAVDVISEQPYQYRVNYTVDAASSMNAWEADLLLEEYKSFVSEAYSLNCAASTAALSAFTKFISNNDAMRDSVSDLYIKPDLAESDVTKSIGKISKPFSKTLFKGLNLNMGGVASTASAVVAAMGGSAIAKTASELPLLFFAGSSAVIILLGIALIGIDRTRKKKPKENDNTLKITSLLLQHSPDDYQVSAIRCRDHNGVIDGAEWTTSDASVKPAVYIADEVKKIKIKIKFKITDKSEKPAGKYNVSINASVCGGEKNLFDNFKYEKNGLVADKEYEAELESSISASVPSDFSYSQIELWWSAGVNGKAIPLPNTKNDVYIIPTKPCPPILLDKNCSSNFIAVEYLKIFTQMLGKKSTMLDKKNIQNNSNKNDDKKKKVTLADLKYRTDTLYESRNFKYGGIDTKYTKCEPLKIEGQSVGKVIKFNEKKFLTDLNNGAKFEIECEVYAAILHYYFNMLGVSCRFAFVINPAATDDKGNEMLHMQDIYPAGSKTKLKPPEFTYHMIVEVSPQSGLIGMDGVCVFDASMGVMVGDSIACLAGYPFYGQNTTLVDIEKEKGTYRGLTIQNGTGAIIHSSIFAFVKVKKF